MFSHIEPLVGGINHEGVVEQSLFFQVIEQATDVVIEGFDHFCIVAHVALKLELRQGAPTEITLFEIETEGVVEMVVDGAIFRIKTADHVEIGVFEVRSAIGREHFAVVVERHVFADFHFGESGGLATGVVIVEIGRKFEGFIFEFVQILQFGEPVAVAGFVVHEESEGLVFVARLIEPVNGFVSDNVREVAFYHIGTVGIVEVRVVIVALCGEDVPMVETGGTAHEVPFTDQRGLIAGFLEQLGHGLLRAVEDAVLVVGKSVFVGVLTGEHAGTRGAAE